MQRRRGPAPKGSGEKYPTRTISMPPDLYEQATAAAVARRLSFSAFVSQAVERHLEDLRRRLEAVA